MKRIELTIEDLFNIPGSVIYEPDKLKSIRSVSVDSRKIKPRALFVAIKGKRFDGHNFVNDAIEHGASAILINKKKLAQYDNVKVPIIAVNNTEFALGEIARIWRKKLSAKVIGITGSTGKTTVKDILAELLSVRYKVNKTEANNNNHIGVPLTILNTSEVHQILVAELGTNHFGEIPYTARILSPEYSLITNIGDSHLEFLRTRNGVWKEKSFLFNETIKNNGKVFLNYDDPIIKSKHLAKGSRICFGFTGKVDVKGKLKALTQDGKPVVSVSYKNSSYEYTLPVYGEHNAKNFLAACAVALELGLTYEDIQEALRFIKLSKGRLNVLKCRDFILIDDTYNANPESTGAAIDLVGSIKTFNRKILFLGDMFELGKNSIRLHEGLGKKILQTRIDEVYTIGPLMKYLHKKLIDKNLIAKHFTNRDSLSGFIRKKNFSDSVILVKGSRGMSMEEFLEEIKNTGVK